MNEVMNVIMLNSWSHQQPLNYYWSGTPIFRSRLVV